MKSALERDVRLVRFEDGTLELALEPSARKTLVGELSKKLADWTGRRWMVAVSAEAGHADAARASRSAQGGIERRRARAIRWCRRCCNAFPAPKSSTCARRRGNADAVDDWTDDMPDAPANESDPDA